MVMKRINKTKNFWVIAYDISDNIRRSRIVKVIERYGIRVNYSVFECMLTDCQFEKLKDKISRLMQPSEDNIIYYPLCKECYSKITYTTIRYTKPQIVAVV